MPRKKNSLAFLLSIYVTGISHRNTTCSRNYLAEKLVVLAFTCKQQSLTMQIVSLDMGLCLKCIGLTCSNQLQQS